MPLDASSSRPPNRAIVSGESTNLQYNSSSLAPCFGKLDEVVNWQS